MLVVLFSDLQLFPYRPIFCLIYLMDPNGDGNEQQCSRKKTRPEGGPKCDGAMHIDWNKEMFCISYSMAIQYCLATMFSWLFN